MPQWALNCIACPRRQSQNTMVTILPTMRTPFFPKASSPDRVNLGQISKVCEFKTKFKNYTLFTIFFTNIPYGSQPVNPVANNGKGPF
jgi:hypothetical protein